MTLDFFMHTMGAMLKRGKARPTLTAEGREIVKKKHNLTDEELDEALKALGERMTEQVSSDMDTLQEMADKKQAKLLSGLRQKRINDERTKTTGTE